MLGSLETLILTTSIGLFSGIILASINHLFGVARDKRKEARAQVQHGDATAQQDADALAFRQQLYDVPKGRTDMEQHFLTSLEQEPAPYAMREMEAPSSRFWYLVLVVVLVPIVLFILLVLWNIQVALLLVAGVVALVFGVWLTRRIIHTR